MRAHDETFLEEILPPEDRVIEAVVARYQRVAPAVTRFARSIAGNDELRVRLGSKASAAKDEIVINPGVFQAAYARSAPVTPTEVALTSALHEAIHLIATDLDDERPIPESWLAHQRSLEDDGADAPPLAELTSYDWIEPEADIDDDVHPLDDLFDPEPELASTSGSVSLLDALHTVAGPAAEAMFLSLEDARQEQRHLTPFPGARSVLSDLYRAAVPGASANARPLGQFALACFLLVGGYFERDDLQRRVAPHVALALDDAVPFLDQVPELDDPWAVGSVALQLIEVARMHGLLTEGAAADSSVGRKTEMAADQAAIAESVDAVRIVTPPLADRDGYEETRQAAQTVSAEHGRHGEADQAGDPATDQLMKVSTAPTIYLPTGQAGKLVVSDFPIEFRRFAPQGRDLLEVAAREWGVAQRRVSGELYPLFLANQRRGLRTGFDAGDLSPYTPLLLGAGLYERMFERRDLPNRRSYGVSLLVDGSASMLQPRDVRGGRKRPWALAAATLGAWTLARLADELQIEFEVAIFNRGFVAAAGDTERSYTDRRGRATGALRRTQGGAAERLTRTVNHYIVKSFAARWRAAEDVLAGLFWMAVAPQEASREVRKEPDATPPISMFDKAANVDEFNLTHAAERLSARNVSHRIIVVLADGMTRGSVEALAETSSSIERGGTMVLGIGIGDDTVQAAYARNQIVERPEKLAPAMVDGVRSALLRSIADEGGDTWWAHATEKITQSTT
ncbi:MAG: hypothetical protein U9N79_09515 [Actinomycetota bacterium]|nr:hypothetical protein [Actinomycetota bacterium]